MFSMKRNDINNLTHSRFLKIEELPHYLDFSLQMFFYSFVPTPPKALRGRLDTKETKNQGGELLDGGLFINAAPFEWSMTLI